jgi:hypothetical protein
MSLAEDLEQCGFINWNLWQLSIGWVWGGTIERRTCEAFLVLNTSRISEQTIERLGRVLAKHYHSEVNVASFQ